MSNNSATSLSLYLRLLRVTRYYWHALVLGMVATIVLSLTDASLAWLIKPIVNKGFIDRDHFFIRWLPVVIIAVFVVRSVSGFLSSYFIARVARSVIMHLRQQLFQHLLRMPVQYFDQQPSGKIVSTLLYNVEQVAQASSDSLVTVLRESTLAIGLVGVMFAINWRLTLIFITVMPLMAWGLRYSSRRMRQLSAKVQSTISEVAHATSELLEGHRVVRLYHGAAHEVQKFERITALNRQQELKVVVTNNLGTAVTQLLVAFPLAVILYFATTPSLGVTAGSFAAIISAVMMLIRPMKRITELNSFIQKGLSGAASIFALLDEPTEPDDGSLSLPRVKGQVDFQHVGFHYGEAERSVLHDIHFSVAPGETIAIVGPSGAGKSTLINLLPRFYQPTQGRILIDGVDIAELRLDNLRSHFALVAQHTVLFNDTIANNIAYGTDQSDPVRLRAAAEQAHALDFINALPQGFDTVVGENGLLLSGGQRQRLAIARALYKAAPILILDEATSALDTEAERSIQAALEALMGHCTTFVIAHRLSTIENADKILVMDAGRVVAFGKHTELLAQGGVYARLYRMQFASTTSAQADQHEAVT